MFKLTRIKSKLEPYTLYIAAAGALGIGALGSTVAKSAVQRHNMMNEAKLSQKLEIALAQGAQTCEELLARLDAHFPDAPKICNSAYASGVANTINVIK